MVVGVAAEVGLVALMVVVIVLINYFHNTK